LSISTWGETEFYGVLGRRARDGSLPLRLAERAAGRFENHKNQGLFKTFPVNTDCMKHAAMLTRRFSLGIKSADALHLALVQLEGLELITSDKSLAESARELALSTKLID
jgi:predicted nucleic acid-binding protein